MKSKNLIAVTAVAAALSAASLAAHADGVPQYSVIDLGAAAGTTTSQGTALSSSGNYALGRSLGTSGPGFVWSAGTGRIDWTMPATGNKYVMTGSVMSGGGVNNYGLAVATVGTTLSGGTLIPEMWSVSNPTLTALAMPAGYTTGRAADVNDSGTAVGLVGSGATQKAVIWNTSTNTASILSATTADGSVMNQANAINNAGLIVGTGLAADGTTKVGLVYNSASGVMSTLDASSIGTGGISVLGVSENGYVTGQIGNTAWIWSASTGMHSIASLVPGSSTAPYGVNSAGWTVGKEGSNAFLNDGTTTYNLTSLLAPNSGWTLTSTSSAAWSIADNGDILVTGIATTGGAVHTLLLAPVPEPASWALMLAGMVSVGAVVRRRAAAQA